jgi:hypothetical protein
MSWRPLVPVAMVSRSASAISAVVSSSIMVVSQYWGSREATIANRFATLPPLEAGKIASAYRLGLLIIF